EDEDERSGDAKQCQQCAQAVSEQHRFPECGLKLIGEPGRVEEERPVVGGGTNIERVGGEKLLAVACQDQAPVVSGASSGSSHLRRLCGNRIWLDAWGVEDRELEIMRDLPQLGDLGLGERRLLQEEGGDAIVADDG